MPHIDLKSKKPGIVGLMEDYPETAKPLLELAEALLRKSSPLSMGERELIAAHVSFQNECHFCHSAHGATAKHLLGDKGDLVRQVKENPDEAPISDKMKALLAVAAQVQKGGRYVTDADIERARKEGVTDEELHDTVLIAAAFCMFNRYVDGLGTFAPHDEALYDSRGAERAKVGYLPVLDAYK